MDFPHLRRDTQFPYLQNVDVYQFQNTFDYTRWNEFTKVRLVNVIWNSDYQNVVKFESNAKRDAWFDGIEDYYAIDLEQACRVVPEGFVKLPVPYDVMARYNYLYVDMPIATDATHPIDFETTDGIRRWYFFINEIVYRAPNTTEVRIVPDVWTNFQNDVEINYMMLERGHAPVAFSDVDEYLADPISNNAMLLAPDVNFGKDTIVRESEYIPFGSGAKMLVLFSVIAPDQISGIGSVSGATSDSWSNPTYSDTSDRFGYQLQVNGYNFGDAGDYSGLSIPVGNGSNDKLPNGVFAYAISADACFGGGDGIDTLMQNCPNFMRSVLAAAVVSSDMLTLSDTTVRIGGLVFRTCVASEGTAKNLNLTSDMFGFPEEYKNFAKLYTYPYSSIEITDNDGKKVDVKIENTGSMQAQLVPSIAFPFLNMRVFITGINGVGSDRYSWRRIDGTSVSKTMPDSDWYEHCFDWAIPTYSIYMSGKIAYNLANYNSLQNARREALVGYHTSVRQANTAMQNSIDAENTAEANVNANATTLLANNANSCNAQTANTAQSVATATANKNSANAEALDIVYHNNSQIAQDATSTNVLSIATTNAQNEVSTATTGMSGGANVLSSSIAGGLSGASLGTAVGGVGFGSILGGVVGAATAVISAAANYSNAMAMVNCSQYVTDQTQQRNDDVASHARDTNTNVQQEMNDDRDTQTNNTNNCITIQTANNVTAATNNANNSANTMNANAARTRATANANSGYTRDVAVTNAKEILENAQARARARYDDARNAQPVQIGSYTGSNAPDYYETRGLQVKVRTQSDGAIRQAGDFFARYGYALNQIWNVAESGLALMKHFTYWKASDIWVDDRSSSNNAVNRAIERMFLDGVTVWTNPDEIGRVSIYAN